MDRTAFLLREYLENPGITQRTLADHMDLSLGTVNSVLSSAVGLGLIADNKVTAKGLRYLKPYKVDSAVILAAGFGSRFAPLSWSTPKGLLPVYGERMVERQITQLIEAGITDITLVVGYMKEKFEYLIDKFGVKLIYNPKYDSHNSLSSVYVALDRFKGRGTYILASDNWLRSNMYHSYEPCSWYSAAYMPGKTNEWCLNLNKKKLITSVDIGGSDSYVMYGPAFISRADSTAFCKLIKEYFERPGTEGDYWEQVILDHPEQLNMYANTQPDDQVYEFENLEELRVFDEKYIHSSDNETMALVSKVLKVPESEIHNIRTIKAGMTNRSFYFEAKGGKYICRMPGEGTQYLINRKNEYENVNAVAPLNISEHVVYFDPETGYKISEFFPDARVADPKDPDDMKKCMRLLHTFHTSGIRVDHDFDLKERMDYYEDLCRRNGGIPYEDYDEVRARADDLFARIKNLNRPKGFTHIDSVPDNFLFIDKDKELRLIDWEYAGMADQLTDLGMCAIYSYYSKEEIDALISMYFEEAGRPVSDTELGLVYAYVALGGLLWALWAICKSSLGVNFGDYTLIMYRYMKDYYKEATKYI